MEPGGQAPQPVHVVLIHARQWVRLLQQGEVDDVLEKLDPVLVNSAEKVIKVTFCEFSSLRAILQKNLSEEVFVK